MVAADEFVFLNETRALPVHGWDDPDVPKLWRYNLHYFDDLNAEDARARADWHRHLIARWVQENPPAGGSGWEPYPTSLRIVNWVKWSCSGNALSPEAVHNLAIQTRWLAKRLEYHLLGNHLFANAKALVFAGCFFGGTEADKWLAKGLSILAREVPEQILGDGAQFELSPMYHALAVEDMLDLINVMRASGLSVPRLWEERIPAMRGWLGSMCHPDGEIAFFNDAAIGIAPSAVELERYAVDLGFSETKKPRNGCIWQRDSGYIRLQDDHAVAIIDVARVGSDYLPGHAHADTLSFELSVHGQRVFVNSGTSVYGNGPERLRQRGTAAHNTVVVNGVDSSEVWSGFRVARRARPQSLVVQEGVDGNRSISCAHDGYRRLVGKPIHHRTWNFGRDTLVVYDRIEGSYQRAGAAFHFHPGLSPSTSNGGQSGAVLAGTKVVLRWRVTSGSARLERSTWHPEFGVVMASEQLIIDLVEGKSVIELSW